jgi:CRISPR/Cas system CSM-associated protein Csm2 small subunit
MSTPAQVSANQSNAQLSTGPTTDAGKAKVSLNAVKTGLTGRTVLLPSDDAAEYQEFCAAYEKEFAPVGQREADLAQSIVDTLWRLRRIPALEMAIYSKARCIDFVDAFQEFDPAVRAAMIDLQAALTYEKQLKNLHLQEARLRRFYEKTLAELRQIREYRRQKQQEARAEAVRLYMAAQAEGTSFDPAANGFDFSIREIESYVGRIHGLKSVFESLAHGQSGLNRLAKAA